MDVGIRNVMTDESERFFKKDINNSAYLSRAFNDFFM